MIAIDVSFQVLTPQGLFFVVYNVHAEVRIFAYGKQEEWADRTLPYQRHDRDEMVEMANTLPLHQGCHEIDLRPMLDKGRRDEAEDLCRRHFLESFIHKTSLEPPEYQDIQRLEFPVRMATGVFVKVVLLGNGRGYVLAKEKWYHNDEIRIGKTSEYTSPHPCSWFTHAIPVSQLSRDAEILARSSFWSSNPETVRLTMKYEDYFWSEINPTLEDRWIRHKDELKGEPLTIRECTSADLHDLLRDVVRQDHAVWASGTPSARLQCTTSPGNGRSAIAGSRASSVEILFFARSTLELAEAILAWSCACGFSYQFTSGIRENMASYSKRGLPIVVEVHQPTATERMDALSRLVAWSDRTGIDIEPYLQDC